MKLEAFERAVVADARRDASARIDRADRDAEELRRAARRRVAEAVARARAEGEAAADRETAHAVVEAKRRARRVVLGSERELFDRLSSEAREAAAALRDREDYPSLLDALAALARTQLGPDARVAIDPPEGGVVAEDDTRRVTYSLDALADRAVAGLASELFEVEP